MGVSTTTNRKDYVGTGTTGPFPYDFYIFEAADMEVWTTDASGIPVQLTSAEYTITGVGLATGGSVTTVAAVPVGYPLALVRVLSYTQPFSFTDLGDFFASQHEAAFDRVTMLIQQLAEITGRGITMPITFTGSATVEGAPTIGYAVGVGASGGLTFVPNMGADQTALLADQASASNGAGRVGFTYALAYAAGTVGKAIKDVMDVANAAATSSDLVLTNSKVAVLQTVPGGYRNYRASCTGASAVITMAADLVTVRSADGLSVGLAGVSLSLNTAAAGVNGLDTGTLAASTWYHKYVIYNPTTGVTAALASLSATAPTMPSGYTHWMRMGAFRTDNSGSKYPFGMTWRNGAAAYRVASGSNVAALPLITSGTLGNPATPTWSEASVSSFVPATANFIHGSIFQSQSSNQAIAAPNNSYGAFASTTNPPPISNSKAGDFTSSVMPFEMMLESTSIYVACLATGYYFCRGWEDAI